MGSPMEATNSISPPCSPASQSNGSMAKMTPTRVRTAQNTASNWLKTVIAPLPSKPSAELEKFLSLGSGSIANDVETGANIVLEAIFPSIELGERLFTWSLSNVNLMDSLWSGQERTEALKLYYKVLESICASEAGKSSSRDLSGLLTKEKFHRCMLACSAELVSMARTRVSILFPSILERAGITAFDMCKVIESFIRHEDSLPRELMRHLNSLEETMLESMVWEKGSSLYNPLIASRPDLQEEIKRLKLLAEPMPSLHEISMNNHVASGVLAYQHNLHKHKPSTGNNGMKRLCDENGKLFISIYSPVQSKTPKDGGIKMDAAVTFLFNKMTKLGAVRINSMAERLKLSQQIREKTYLLFRQILVEKTYLFFNRHIDLIILCCFCGVAKINKLKLKFEEITDNYVKEPQCRSQDFGFVFAGWLSKHNGKNRENYKSIDAFYNQVFILNVVSLVKDIGSTEAPKQVPEADNDICPKTPRQPSPFPRIPDISPKKVSPSQNVYLSPLKPSKASKFCPKDALNSHLGKSYYAYFGESTSAYQSPSKDLDAINKRINSTNKRRRTLNFDDVNPALISDAVVAKSLLFENDKRAQ
ncbi:retinoblastoma-related protein 1 [Citrus sinensis]|uniref:Retinoblastoma-related protein 1 n=1 Tax=Citrus sinensis TaxID=2711 RepID=A0ACB8N086_CITSI|nr:retinoblastoma-related protein 1 [Citrus sinensis]